MMGRTRARSWWLASFAAVSVVLASCGERGSQDASSSGAPSSVAATNGAAPEQRAPFVPSRETPVQAANSIRELARTTMDPTFIVEYIDPSQKWSNSEGGEQTGGAPALVGPALIYFARLHDLREAAIARFGDDAGPAIDEAATFFQIDALANGIKEMFGAAKLEQVNQIGPLAYVAPLDETGEQVGASIVVKENQGEWLWVLLEGNTPWDQRRMGFFSAFLTKPLEGAPLFAREFEAITDDLREGRIGSLSEATERIRAIPAKIG